MIVQRRVWHWNQKDFQWWFYKNQVSSFSRLSNTPHFLLLILYSWPFLYQIVLTFQNFSCNMIFVTIIVFNRWVLNFVAFSFCAAWSSLLCTSRWLNSFLTIKEWMCDIICKCLTNFNICFSVYNFKYRANLCLLHWGGFWDFHNKEPLW